MHFSVKEKGKRAVKTDLSKFSTLVFLCGFVVLYSAVTCEAWPWSNEQRKAERHFRKNNFEQALKHYENARLRAPDNPALDYNIGNVFHMDNRFQEAVDEYSKAIPRSQPVLKEMTNYNMGNTFYRMGDMNRAIESYINALLENPDDHDAKHNVEMALRMIEQQKQKQQQRQDKQEKKEEEKEEQQREEKEEGKSEEREQPQPKEGELSKEQAERILDALNEQERKERKELKKPKTRAKVSVEKDW